MHKYILLLILSMVTTGCTGVAKVKDRYHRAPFEKEIEKGNYDVTLYKIEYPEKYEEKIRFYSDFNILMTKLLVYDSTVNILYPEELKNDILKLRHDFLLPEEEVYAKSSSELSKKEMELIDKQVSTNMDKEELGRAQYYLNKQVYFWKNLLKKDQDSKQNYSELEKERLVQEVKEIRKEMFEIMDQVELTVILGVSDPYRINKDTYWQEKEVYINRATKISPQILKETNYIYLKNISDRDAKKIIGGELKFDSKIVIIENNIYDGYTVIDGKYIFFNGGKYSINYYDGYTVKFKIKDIALEDLLTIDDNLLISDFLNPSLYKERQGK